MKNLTTSSFLVLLLLYAFSSSAQGPVFAGSGLDSQFTYIKASPALTIEDNASFTLNIAKDISITLITSYHIAQDRIPFDYTVCDAGVRFNGSIQGRSISLNGKVTPLLKQDSINSSAHTFWTQNGGITTLYHGYGHGGRPGSAIGCSGNFDNGPSLWLEKSNRFLGFKYTTDSVNYRYGWMEISHPTGKSLVLHSYGFESDTTIDTAMVLMGISEHQPVKTPAQTVPQLQQNLLSFSGLPNGQGIPYRIFGTSGNLLYEGTYVGSPIHTPLQRGIYIVQYDLPDYGQAQHKLYNH